MDKTLTFADKEYPDITFSFEDRRTLPPFVYIKQYDIIVALDYNDYNKCLLDKETIVVTTNIDKHQTYVVYENNYARLFGFGPQNSVIGFKFNSSHYPVTLEVVEISADKSMVFVEKVY